MKRIWIFVAIVVTLIIFVPIVTVHGGNQKPIEIIDAQTLDPNGNPKTVFSRGETVVVSVTIKYTATYYYYASLSYLLIVEDFAPDLTIPGLGFVMDNIDPGEQKTVGYGFILPYDTPTGIHKIWVYVWNGWPSVMGAQWDEYAEPVCLEITVTG